MAVELVNRHTSSIALPVCVYLMNARLRKYACQPSAAASTARFRLLESQSAFAWAPRSIRDNPSPAVQRPSIPSISYTLPPPLTARDALRLRRICEESACQEQPSVLAPSVFSIVMAVLPSCLAAPPDTSDAPLLRR